MFKLPDKVAQDINNYKGSLEEFTQGSMHSGRFTGIRVPWGIYSHRGGKRFMTRIRIVAGLVTSSQLKAIAHASRAWGNGIVHVTTRQDIQLHEVKIEDTITVIEYLKKYDLSPRGGGGNTLRNVTACPLAGVCKDEAFDVMGHAAALTEYLLAQDASYNMPRKFKIAFSSCSKDCSGCLVNDVGLLAVIKGRKRGYKIYVGGGMGAISRVGRLLEGFVGEEEFAYNVTAVRNVFYKNGDRRNKHHNRLRFLIETIGFDKFKKLYDDELKSLKESEYIALRDAGPILLNDINEEIPSVKNKEFEDFQKYNVYPQKQKGYSAIGLRIPRGDISCDTVDALAGMEKEFAGIEFRTSKDQDIFICNVRNSLIHELFLKLKGILSDYLYPGTVLDVVSCKGALTCNLGLCNSPALTEEVEKIIKDNFIGSPGYTKLNIKINGCPNSCGQHPIGLIALHGMVRKVSGRPVPFYKLFLGGKVDLENTRLAKDTGIVIPARNVPKFLKDFIAAINKDLKGGADIYKYIDEKGLALAKEVSSKYLYVPDYSENRDFYIDWGRAEEFSLDGLGAGECGAGIIDMIEADLNDAGIVLDKAKANDYSADEIREGLFLSARALLVVRGSDPRDAEKAFSDFVEKFIKEGIAPSRFSDLKEVYGAINEALTSEERKAEFLYASDLFNTVKKLYESMDSALNFPGQTGAAHKEEVKSDHVYDLKGTPCPINYVKSKMFLENLNIGEIVDIFLDEGEPIKNVPKSLENDGQEIIKIEKLDGFYKVTVRKSR